MDSKPNFLGAEASHLLDWIGFFPLSMNGYTDAEFVLYCFAEAALVQTSLVTCSLLSVSAAALAQLLGGGGHPASKDALGNLW